MLKHKVYLELQDSITGEKISELKKQLMSLELIDGVSGFKWYKNNSEEGLSKGFAYCFEFNFQSHQTRNIYIQHPKHKKVVEQYLIPNLKNNLDSILVFDHEI